MTDIRISKSEVAETVRNQLDHLDQLTDGALSSLETVLVDAALRTLTSPEAQEEIQDAVTEAVNNIIVRTTRRATDAILGEGDAEDYRYSVRLFFANGSEEREIFDGYAFFDTLPVATTWGKAQLGREATDVLMGQSYKFGLVGKWTVDRFEVNVIRREDNKLVAKLPWSFLNDGVNASEEVQSEEEKPVKLFPRVFDTPDEWKTVNMILDGRTYNDADEDLREVFSEAFLRIADQQEKLGEKNQVVASMIRENTTGFVVAAIDLIQTDQKGRKVSAAESTAEEVAQWMVSRLFGGWWELKYRTSNRFGGTTGVLCGLSRSALDARQKALKEAEYYLTDDPGDGMVSYTLTSQSSPRKAGPRKDVFSIIFPM